MSISHPTCISTDNREQALAAASSALTESIVAYIAECRQSDHPASHLISILHKVQSHFGYLGPAQLDAVAQLLGVPAAKVAGVASFYHFFRMTPRGQFVINICLGTACYVKGADRVARKIMDHLGIAWGETTKDGVFTLEGSRCLGTCGLAPVIMIGDDVHPNVTPEQVPAILDKYSKKGSRPAKDE